MSGDRFRRTHLHVRKRELKAFDRLISTHVAAAYALARELAPDENEAEEILTEVCKEAVSQFHPSGIAMGSFKAWLFRIVYRTYRNRHRQPCCRADARLGEVARNDDSTAPRRNSRVDEDFFNNVTREELIMALAELPAEFRVALLLCDCERFRYDDIRQVLDCDPVTVRLMISRARTYLFERLSVGREATKTRAQPKHV